MMLSPFVHVSARDTHERARFVVSRKSRRCGPAPLCILPHRSRDSRNDKRSARRDAYSRLPFSFVRARLQMLGCRHIDRQRHQEHNTDGACGVVNPVKQRPLFGINRNHDVLPCVCPRSSDILLETLANVAIPFSLFGHRPAEADRWL